MADVCDSRKVTAPDGREIPIPLGELDMGEGHAIDVPAEADVKVSVTDTGQYYVAIDAAGPSNDEAKDLFAELITETSIKVLENLAEKAFIGAAGLAIEIAGGVAGVLVSLFTSSNVTREVVVRGNLSDDNAPVTYCLLADAE